MERPSWVEELTEKQLTELLNPAPAFLQTVHDRFSEIVRTTYFRQLTEEDEIIGLLRTKAVGRPYATDEDARQQFIEGARRFGDSQKVEPVFYQVRAGYRGDFHPPLHGPCCDWLAAADLRRNPPTPHAVTFFLPSAQALWHAKTVRQQRELLRRQAQKSGLALHLVRGFSPLAMLAGHVLAHYVDTGEVRLLPDTLVRTSTYRTDNGLRLLLGYFDDYGLRCHDWGYYGGRRHSSYLGCFPLGVQELGF